MSLRIRKGDRVIVISGKDKGKIGNVLKADPLKNRVIVEGVNLVKKHLRKRSEEEPGGIKEIPASIHISNVALYCNYCKRGVRFGIREDNETKIRVCKKCQQPI